MRHLIISLLSVVSLAGCFHDDAVGFFALEDTSHVWLDADGNRTQLTTSGGRLIVQGIIPRCFSSSITVTPRCTLRREGSHVLLEGLAEMSGAVGAQSSDCRLVSVECVSPVIEAGDYLVYSTQDEAWQLTVSRRGKPLPQPRSPEVR